MAASAARWWKQLKISLMLVQLQKCLTRLTWLTHTPFLPSIWDPDKIFASAVELGQVHMANKKFPIFLHAGRGNRKGERSLQLSITFIIRSFGLIKAIALIAQSAEQQTIRRSKDWWYEPC